MFRPSQEYVIEPSDKNLFPEYDWLIGNHSDELTPWLPVIAAKSSYTTRFFVIPCCPHDFACKYRRRDAGRSQYSDYLEYVKEVGTVCGFEVWQDKLRIPSTKRICFIGQNRTYRKEDAQRIIKDIDRFVRQRERTNSIVSEQQEGNNDIITKVQQEGNRDITAKDGEHVEKQLINDTDRGKCSEKRQCPSNLWSGNFKARDSVQQVRNCTQLKKGLREELVSTVANMLMEKKHIIKVFTANIYITMYITFVKESAWEIDNYMFYSQCTKTEYIYCIWNLQARCTHTQICKHIPKLHFVSLH